MKMIIIDCGFGNHGNIRAAINKIGFTSLIILMI